LSDFSLVDLSLTMHAKLRIVVQLVVAMSHCRSAQIEGLPYKPSDRVTSRQQTTQQQAILRASLEAGQQCDKVPFGVFR
jgi:hypothetical protein